ncbi:MAG: hypothetical protein ABL927_00655, partial [Bdellovibrionales bacterium]
MKKIIILTAAITSITLSGFTKAHAVMSLGSTYGLYAKLILVNLSFAPLEMGRRSALTTYSPVTDLDDGGTSYIEHKGKPWIGIP